MTVAAKNKKTAEFGDFQTPPLLAAAVCELLQAAGANPASIVEPTCGVGNFLIAALSAFPGSKYALGVEINDEYVSTARARIAELGYPQKIDLHRASFFTAEWETLIRGMPDPVLLIGNPPWVTNAHLGSLGSDNLPTKSNFQKHAGFDAITGKSNFDISEWMLVHLLERLQGKQAILAMLCKTAVGRKALTHAWKNEIRIQDSSLYLIDAAEHFGAAVDACLLVCRMDGSRPSRDCHVFNSLASKTRSYIFGYRDNQLVAEVECYDSWKHLQGIERYKWRSGIKHDCSAIMELRQTSDAYTNGLGERIELESDFIYPMLKSSDVAAGATTQTDRRMLVPQSTTGEDTNLIERRAPKTWAYLQKHGHLLDRRGSSIYRKRPRFSIFGVGSYTFSPWKVAISGFYKSLNFRAVGPIGGKPTVFDDTCNFIPCAGEAEANFMATLLNSSPAAEFFRAFIFWDAKRPLTVDLLRRIDLLKVAESLGVASEANAYLNKRDENAAPLFAR